jgi:hypothetical protein
MDNIDNSDLCFDTYGNYYINIGGLKLKKITKKEYMDITGESSFLIDKLKNSIYPEQYRDYVFLKIPDNFPKDEGENIAGKYITCDWMLSNLITFLWNRNIITLGWDQGVFNKKTNIDYPGFISMDHSTIDRKEVLPLLKQIFGEKNIIIFDFIKKPEEKPKSGKEIREFKQNKALKFPKKIRIKINQGFISINFNHKMIPTIYKNLKLKPVNPNHVHKGGRFLSKKEIERYEIV